MPNTPTTLLKLMRFVVPPKSLPTGARGREAKATGNSLAYQFALVLVLAGVKLAILLAFPRAAVAPAKLNAKLIVKIFLPPPARKLPYAKRTGLGT
jgi:hypothetical protein